MKTVVKKHLRALLHSMLALAFILGGIFPSQVIKVDAYTLIEALPEVDLESIELLVGAYLQGEVEIEANSIGLTLVIILAKAGTPPIILGHILNGNAVKLIPTGPGVLAAWNAGWRHYNAGNRGRFTHNYTPCIYVGNGLSQCPAIEILDLD